MRLFVTQGELNKHFLSFDNIHDPAIYGLDINDPTLVDTTELAVRSLLQEHKQNTILSKQTPVIPETEKISLLQRMNWNERQELKNKIKENQRKIRNQTIQNHSIITPRTQAKNTKSSYSTVDEERAERGEVLSSQIRTWRSLLPTLIRRFSKIPDPRRPSSVKHSLVMLMLYGLFAFIFQLNSRRAINRELTGPLIHEHLRKIFPEMDSIPHADTLAH